MSRAAPFDDRPPARRRPHRSTARPSRLASVLTIASLAAAFVLVLIPHAGLSLPLSARVPDAVAAAGVPESTCSAGNVVVYARSLVVPPNQWICGDADAYGGSVRVQGHVSGNVTAVGGSVVVSGEVDGNITAFGGSVTLLSRAHVAGNVEALGGSAQVSPEAMFTGNPGQSDRFARVANVLVPGERPGAALPWPWVLAWLLLSAVVITIFPERTFRVRRVIGSAAVRSGVVGLLTCVLGFGLAGLLFVTCIGIPVSFVLMAMLLAGWVLGSVAAGLWLGELILRRLAPGERSPMLPAVVGMAVLAGAELVPCIGGPLAVIAGCVGLGAALISRFGSPRLALALPTPSPR